MQNTNITGAFLCSKYAIPVMKRNHYGRIIMTSSVTAQQGALFRAGALRLHQGARSSPLQRRSHALSRSTASPSTASPPART